MGQFMSTNIQKTVPYDSITQLHASEIDPRWKSIISFAKSCTGKVALNNQHLGCGILVGIDRVLIPAHVIANTIPSNLNVSFSVENDQYCFFSQFKVLNAHPISEIFVILQLESDAYNKHAGNNIRIPEISGERHEGEFLFSTYSGDNPLTQISRGASCFEPGGPLQFCSVITTVKGDCGGGYFDLEGRLFGVHVSRSSGMCTLSAEMRQAIYSIDIRNGSHKAQQLFSMNVCTPMRSVAYISLTIDSSSNNSFCFIEEGRKVNPIPIEKDGITYYAHHDGHGGKHCLPQDTKFNQQKKIKLINRTIKDSAMFYPNVIHARNYEKYVQECVEAWLNRDGGPDLKNRTVQAPQPVGADRGKETNIIKIYQTDLGAHIRPYLPSK